MGFDGKYGVVTTEHGDIPPDEPVIVFRARDILLPELLDDYISLCEFAGSPQRHMDLVAAHQERILTWQDNNPDKVRRPDSERSREWMDH